jgi:hypothetical protein
MHRSKGGPAGSHQFALAHWRTKGGGLGLRGPVRLRCRAIERTLTRPRSWCGITGSSDTIAGMIN